MFKKIVLIALLLTFVVNVGGCTFSLFQREKRKAYIQSVKGDISEINSFWERFILNYDEGDPTKY